MPKKRRKRKKKVLSLPTGISREPEWDKAINPMKVNQLWRWTGDLEDVKF